MTARPIPHTLFSLLERSTTIKEALQAHSFMLKCALDTHLPSFCKLISSLLSSNPTGLAISHARSLLDLTPTESSIFAWNSMLRAYSRSPFPCEAIKLFVQLRRRGLVLDNFTFSFVVKACGSSSRLEEGEIVHCQVLKTGFDSDLFVGNTLLHMYGACRSIHHARQVFDEMPQRDVVSWSSMIAGHVSCNYFHEALMVFQRMKLAKVEPNHVTLVSLLSACSHLGNLNLGESIHAHIASHNIELNVVLGTALVEMYAKSGHIEKALQVFSTMSEKNLHSWTVMISGLAEHSRGEDAISLFKQMETSDLKPDGVSFSSILCACSHLGLVEEGRLFFIRMRRVYGIQPTMEHYGCMVDLFARAGLVEEAYEFIKEMPMKPNSVILRSFLGACRNHGVTFRVDKSLMKLLLEVEPKIGANYVLAASVSALSGRWEDVAELRRAMKENDLKKAPGCSWVEEYSSITC